MQLLVILILVGIVIAYVLANIAFGLWVAFTFIVPIMLALLIYAVPATMMYYVAYRIWREFK